MFGNTVESFAKNMFVNGNNSGIYMSKNGFHV